MRARTSLEEGFVARMMYPEVEGIRDVLHAVKWSDEEVDIAEAKELLEIALRFAMDARKKSHDYYSEQAATLESEGSEESLIEARRFHFLAYHMGEKSVFKELFKYDLNRFEADGTASMLFELYKTITGEMDGSEFAINSNDEARINQQIQEQE